MKIEGSVIVLTGAAGGIGQPLAKALAAQGARMLLVDRDQQALEQLKHSIPQTGQVEIFAVDLLDSSARQTLLTALQQMTPAVDMLINVAGLLSFCAFEQEDQARIEAIMTLNSIVPMQLTRALLASMLKRDSGHIINIGSTFGSIGFAYFASYSASKFAMRGFSESLRRELQDTAVKVSYIAPRAVKTALNTDRVYAMGEATGMNMDEPAWVADQVVKAIIDDSKNRYLGFPEKLFVRINAILPGLVDKALAAQNRVMAKFV